MQGLMMDYPLTLQYFFNRAVHIFSRKEIVTQTETGLHRYTFGEWGKRTTQLANALHHTGVKEGDRIATFGWNTYRHLELYFAIPCIGAVLHTLNIRLFADQLNYIINNAEDSMIFVDSDLVPILENLADQLTTVKQYVVMGTRRRHDGFKASFPRTFHGPGENSPFNVPRASHGSGWCPHYLDWYAACA